MIPSIEEIGRSLQSVRKNAGFRSAKEFAESIGFNPSTYTQYEQGKRRFNYEQAWIMADALDCSIDALGGRKPPRKYADPRQDDLNEAFNYLDDSERDSALGAVRGIASSQARKKAGSEGPDAGEGVA